MWDNNLGPSYFCLFFYLASYMLGTSAYNM